WLSRIAPLANLRNAMPWLARLTEYSTGIAARRKLPQWRLGAAQQLRRLAKACAASDTAAREVVLLPDTFDLWFEPNNLDAAARVLRSAGYRVTLALPRRGRPLCCGRTWLAAGMVEEARAEARRTLDVIAPFARAGVPIIGLEPSCLFGFRDEIPNLLAGEDAQAVERQAQTLAQFIAAEQRAGNWQLEFDSSPFRHAIVHGHCHEKAFDAFDDVLSVLQSVQDLEVHAVESSCCGMAGAFGYSAEHFDVSMQMAEAALLPAVRAASPDTVVIADGTSCRHQIADGAQRRALHLAELLGSAISGQLAGE
ncbi:MAG TPA: heterodisulfide reductase-related iron-sulfur binding cluster, partial [Gammaproteobacteria bacterium]|nr:heterodisulfide reductase-related iron-sulfur binding cluster [Gammaproteobacteria bacterium]